MAKGQGKVGAAKSAVVAAVPLACTDEAAAVEFFERRLWNGAPRCPRCESADVVKILSKTGERGPRFLWRCHGCKQQFTVRIGTVLEDSRIPLRHWAYAFWAACASKKGVSALQIQRQTGVSYKSALFLMHRIRFAMSDEGTTPRKLSGTVEMDTTFVGGKPRFKSRHNMGTYPARKSEVLVMVERDGELRAADVRKLTVSNLAGSIARNVDAERSTLMTDTARIFRRPGRKFAGGHFTTDHGWGEYAKPGGIHSNTAEGFFALLKRGVYGTFHSVSKKHLHRYISEFQFRYNTRKMDDGERMERAIQAAHGKRLFYKAAVNG